MVSGMQNKKNGKLIKSNKYFCYFLQTPEINLKNDENDEHNKLLIQIDISY